MKLEVLHRPAAGYSNKPTLLLIHGSYCAAWVWTEHYLPFFAAQGYPCAAVSLRGHGESPGNLAFASFADYVADVAGVAAGLGPTVLLGHSLGGLVAQHVAAAVHRVSGLVMLASTPPSGLGMCSLHMMTHAPEVLMQLWLLQSLGAAAVSAPAMHRALFSPDTPMTTVEAMLPRLQRESNRVMFELLTPPRLRPRADGAVPSLVVGGDADKFLPVHAFDEAAAFWNAEKHILRGAPHALMADSRYWRSSADIILDWLTRQEPQAS